MPPASYDPELVTVTREGGAQTVPLQPPGNVPELVNVAGPGADIVFPAGM